MCKEMFYLSLLLLSLNLQNAWGSNDKIEWEDNTFKKLKSTFDKIDKELSQENKVVIIGGTGAGKSSIFNYMQHDLKYKYVGNDVLYSREDGKQFVSCIKSGIVSETTVPTVCGEFVDCPGFEDSRNIVQAIINAYSIHRLLEKADSTKILFVVKHAEFEASRAENFVTNLRRLGRMFANDINKLLDGLCLVVTSITDLERVKDPVESEKNSIERAYKDLEKIFGGMDQVDKGGYTENEKQNSKKILHTLMNRQNKKVGVFSFPKYTKTLKNVLKNERNTIEGILGRLKPIKKSKPNLILNDEGKNLIKDFFSNELTKCSEIFEKCDRDFEVSLKNYIKLKKKKLTSVKLRDHFKKVGEEIKIITSAETEAFVRIIGKFSQETNDFLLLDKSVKKLVKRFKFMEKIGVGFNSEMGSLCSKSAKDTIVKIKTLSKKIKLMSSYKFEKVEKIIRLSGYIIGTSDLHEKILAQGLEKIEVFSFHSFLLDKDIEAFGANLIFFSPYWFRRGVVTINISGRDGENLSGQISENDGLPGNPGFPGGNFYGRYREIFGKRSFTIRANGGNGSNGSDGGIGKNGTDGVSLDREFVEGSRKEKEEIFNKTVTKRYRIAKKATKGAQGYSGGAKGLGGKSGEVSLNSEKGTPYKDFEKFTIDGKDGKSGNPGKGGLGGLYPDICEFYEVKDEVSFGRIKNKAIRRAAQIGMGIITVGTVPLYTGVAALWNSEDNMPSNNDVMENPSRALSGKDGDILGNSKPICLNKTIDKNKEEGDYLKFLEVKESESGVVVAKKLNF